MSTVKAKCGSHVRVLEGRNKGCLGTIRSITTDEIGDDYFVEYSSGGRPAEWVRPCHAEVFYVPATERRGGAT